MQENNEQFENLTKENLIVQLKEKIKENKTITKKLDRLSEKYVQTYKEYKLLAKDRESLFQAIHFALSDQQYQFEQKPLGQFDCNSIIDLLKQKDEDKSKALTNLIKETNNEKFQLEEKYRQMIEKQGSNSDQKTQQIIKQLKQQINDLDNNNTRLAKEIIELNDIIQIKNGQILKLSQLEDDCANLKTQLMVQELQQQQPDRQWKISSSDSLNESLKMKQQVDKLLEEIQKQSLKIKQLELENANFQLVQKTQVRDNYSNHIGFTKTPNDYDEVNPFEQEITLQKQDLNQNILSNQKQTQTDFIYQTKEELQSNNANFEYLKNVVYKYFLYQETRNYKEASILMNAIMTILKMTNDERRRIEQARERGFLKSAKNLISDGFFCLKQPQLNDMNFERPNSRIELMNKHMLN
ncbi:unnamed protein product (macronuclear) [Paramecium tetraurelia]|uniref:GRIP domain-containing protein n=1 Tax=Paramecium tetraurelia TaxID=5888 RepID=A0DAN4_PARTE|nr:uncharacterized protein GSPATT00015008001 [Paramecium tetraurelia]CAK80101.1 unnamed protein product [Paramecium tetraurelia]|eukprot:XP_001447498.1 hypothetical protein (macronuclear) [Paramecium tetraurelia strain d4-2]